MQRQTLTSSLFPTLAMLLIGCGGSSATAPEATLEDTLTGPLPPTVALFDLHVDPDALSAELTQVRANTAQPPQNLSYDLDIGKFLTHETLQVAGISLDNFSDVIVRIRHRHPFPAPDFSAGITAKNRADLSYTGRLFVFAETDVLEYAPGITLDNALVREPDGWASPGDLLRNAAGLTASHYPYMLLIDEAKDNREGVSNGDVMTGNYSAATGGWQRANAGPDGDGWTGYDYLHGGQSVVNDITLRRIPMAAANWTVRLAVVIQYTDPRGLADLTRRFPMNPADVQQFAYRLPYAALDASQVATNWDVPLRPGASQFVPLEVRVRDWDAEAEETTGANLGDESDVSLVQPEGAGHPDVTFTMDQVYTGEQTVPYVSGTGLPGDELVYRLGVNNDNQVALGNYRGLLQVEDREMQDAARGSYHFGVDAITLAASASRRLDAITVYPLQFQVPYAGTGWSVGWGDYKNDGARAIAVDAEGNVAVASNFNHGAFDLIPGDIHARVPWAGGWDVAINLFDPDGVQLGGFAFGGNNHELVDHLEFDSAGNLVLIFNTDSDSCDVDPGPGILDLGGPEQHFGVVKYSPAGAVQWGIRLPEASVDGPSSSTWVAMAQSPDDELLFGGRFEGTADFDPGAAVVSRTSNGGGTNSDAVVLRLQEDGSFRWVRIWGGANDAKERILAIACTSAGDAVVGGSLGLENSDGSGTIDLDPTAGNDDRPSAFRGTPFFARLAANGSYQSGQTWLKQSTGVGEPDGFGEVNSIALDDADRVYVRGGYGGTGDFDPGVGEFLLTGYLTEFMETFTASYDTDNSFRWAFPYFSQSNFLSESAPFFISPEGNLISIAFFNSTDQCDFDPGPAVASTTTQGLIYNQYLASYTTDGDFRFLGKWGSLSSSVVSDLAPTPDGRLVLCGSAHPNLSALGARGESRALQNVIGGADSYLMNLSADCEW